MIKTIYKDKKELTEYLEQSIEGLTGKNNKKLYNLFLHHIDKEKIKSDAMVLDVASGIIVNGLNCKYSTACRTMTYIGNHRNYEINRIINYSYTADNSERCVILLAIPQNIKTSNGEVVDFSTPQGNNFGWKEKYYSLFDKVKDYVIDSAFVFCSININEGAGKYSIWFNDKHITKAKSGEVQQILNYYKNKINNLNSDKNII